MRPLPLCDRGLCVPACALIVLLGLAACERERDPAAGAERTSFPGQFTAGGSTSGAVMAAAKDMRNVSREAGTPGIPQGSGGNTGGTAMGGTTGSSALGNSGGKTADQQRAGASAPAHGQAAASAAAAPAASAASAAAVAGAPAASQAAAQAAQQKQLLDERMASVTARWRQRAAAEHWPTHPPIAVDAQAGFRQSQALSTATAAPQPVKSEKAGTAAPSADVKQPRGASAPRR